MKKLETQYEDLTCLLLYFLEDGYYEDRKDIDTIKRYVSVFDSRVIQKTLEQGMEVLGLDPFPVEWITDEANRGLGEIDNDINKAAFIWMQWIVKTLEEEAEKAGKNRPETQEEKKVREDKERKQLEEAKEVEDFWCKYPTFAGLIKGFFIESLLLDVVGKTDALTRKDRMLNVVSEYVKERDKSEIQNSLEESRSMFESVDQEVIKKMIKRRSNNYLNRIGAIDQSPEGYHYWLGLIHNTLEEEAEKAGKL